MSAPAAAGARARDRDQPWPWLGVVGIGEDGLVGLNGRARDLIEAADLFVGGSRHLGFLGSDPRPRVAWRSPLADTLAELERFGDRRTVVLASGDPLWHGVGALLLRNFPERPIEIVPTVSAFQLACARLGWPLEEVVTLSLHGRPLDGLRRLLNRGQRLLLLTSGSQDPHCIASLLVEEGFGAAGLHVLERLGGPFERVIGGTANSPPAGPFAELNMVAVDLAVPSLPRGLPLTPGLPDDAFLHDGQITKPEMRAATLARLAPRDGELLWDVGAGSGSIAIEWLRSGRRLRALAIEMVPARAERIRSNARRLGVSDLEVVEGRAPGCLAGLPTPDAVFMGGGVADEGLLEACWRALASDGRLIANAVTISGEAALLAFRVRHGGTLVRIAVARAETVGTQLAWRPLMPVTQLAVIRSCGAVG